MGPTFVLGIIMLMWWFLTSQVHFMLALPAGVALTILIIQVAAGDRGGEE